MECLVLINITHKVYRYGFSYVTVGTSKSRPATALQSSSRLQLELQLLPGVSHILSSWQCRGQITPLFSHAESVLFLLLLSHCSLWYSGFVNLELGRNIGKSLKIGFVITYEALRRLEILIEKWPQKIKKMEKDCRIELELNVFSLCHPSPTICKFVINDNRTQTRILSLSFLLSG